MKLRVLITGGAGFIGSRLARVLRDVHEVLVFDNFHPQVHGFRRNPDSMKLLDGCTVVQGDVEDRSSLEATVRYFDPHVAYHLAAETGTGQSHEEPARYSSVNVTGTANLLELLRQPGRSCSRVILASSRSVYGEGMGATEDGAVRPATERKIADLERGDFDIRDRERRRLRPLPMSEFQRPAPASVYASTKLMQEFLLSQCLVGTKIEPVTLRFQNVYGPGQSLKNPYTGVVTIFASLIKSGGTPEVFEDGNIFRDFVFVDDVVEALRLCLSVNGVSDAPINIGSGAGVSILEMAQHLLGLYGRDRHNFRISGRFRPGDVRHAVADISRAQRLLNWTPTKGFAQGLEALVAWIEGQTGQHSA